MLRTKGFTAIAVIVAGVAARTNAMESHRTAEKSMAGVRPRSRDPKQPAPNGLIHDFIGLYPECHHACTWRSKPSF